MKNIARLFVFFACVLPVMAGAQQQRQDVVREVPGSRSTISISTPIIGELGNLSRVDVDLGRQLVEKLACVADTAREQFLQQQAQLNDSLALMPATDTAFQRARDKLAMEKVQLLWQRWLNSHLNTPCVYKTGNTAATPRVVEVLPRGVATYHMDNNQQLVRHPIGRPFGLGFTSKADLRKQVADTTSAEYKRLWLCILRFAGMDSLQAAEYISKLRSGEFTLAAPPHYIAWNSSCGAMPGRNIQYEPGNEQPAMAARVVLTSGLVVYVLHSCSNVLTPTQVVEYTVQRWREEVPRVEAAPPPTPVVVINPLEPQRAVVYFNKWIALAGSVLRPASEVTAEVGQLVVYEYWLQCRGPAPCRNMTIWDHWPRRVKVDSTKTIAPTLALLTQMADSTGLHVGFSRPMQPGQDLRFWVYARATTDGRFANVAVLQVDDGPGQEFTAWLNAKQPPSFCERKPGWCIGPPLAAVAIWLLWPRGHHHAAPPSKPYGGPPTGW